MGRDSIRQATRAAIAAMMAGAILAACNAATAGTRAYGDRIDPGPKPDAATCQRLLRSDVVAATRIRAALSTPGVAADEASARAAAADPAANTDLVGVPLTAAEVASLRQSGMAFDPSDPLAYWVHAGAPERFGGMWGDGGVALVAVVDGDAGSIALARCVEPVPAREVWADISYADGQAIVARLVADRAIWGPAGGQLNVAYYDETTGWVDVGVTAPNARLETDLRDAFGPRIRVHQEGPAQPD